MTASCAGMDRRAAEVAELATARARAGEALEVAHVRVDGLRRPRQAGGDGRVDDPAARPVEPRLERAGLGAQVGLAERDAGDAAGRRDLEAASTPTRRLDQAVDAAGRSQGRRSGPVDLRHVDAVDRERRDDGEVVGVARR